MNEERYFIPGDHWVYYKIYLMPGLADHFLVTTMYPIIRQFSNKGWTRLWFFIRYNDPDFHLKIRLRLESTSHLASVLRNAGKEIQPWLRDGQIKNVQLDTYRREYERYGSQNIRWIEQVFCHDSETILALLNNPELDQELRWLAAIKSTDRYLSDFNLPFETRKTLLYKIFKKLSDNMPGYGEIINRLNKKFRYSGKQLENAFFSSGSHDRRDIFDVRSLKNREAIHHIMENTNGIWTEDQFSELVAAILHLSLNRLFARHQQLNELATYIMLFRYYKSKLGREKYDKNYEL